MDKTIEVIVVAMVAIVTGLVVLYLVNGQSEGFGNFLDNQQSDAQCQLLEERGQCQEFLEKGCEGSCTSDSSNTDSEEGTTDVAPDSAGKVSSGLNPP